MQTRMRAVVITLVAAVTVALVAGSVLAGPLAQGSGRATGLATFASLSASLTGSVASKISYQGRLTDAAGNPLDGNYNLVFQLWDDATAGSQVGGDVAKNNVPVSGGLFTVELDVPQEAFNGQALWLRIQVNGQWLSPRQELLPVPYALSLRPGARIVGDSAGAVLTTTNQGVGPAIEANSAGVGVDALGQTGVYAEGWAVGVDASGMVGVRGQGDIGVRGDGLTGVHGESEIGTGVAGTAIGLNGKGVEGIADNYGGTGVSGHATFGTGVVGNGEIGVKGTSAINVGVKGEGFVGVEGSSETGDGVVGETAGGWETAAVRGVATGDGYGGYFTSTTASGVIAYGYEGLHAEATSEAGYGVHGVGLQGAGVQGDSSFGYGVSGEGQLGGVFGTSGFGAGVEGRVESGSGVVGVSTSGSGVVGNSVSGTGVYGNTGSGTAAVMGEGPKGVYGKSSADYGEAVHGEGLGEHTEGVLGTATGSHGTGVYGIASATTGDPVGVWGQTGATWGLLTYQRLYTGGGCTNCTVAFIGQNADTNTLEVGDVVSISGVASPLKGQQTPTLKVQRATANGSGALGVIQARAAVTTREMPVPSDAAQTDTVEMPGVTTGPVAPGDYLFVVVQGLVQVRVDASAGAIQVGDLVGPGGAAGLTQKLDLDTPEAPALGRALEPLTKGTGLIWVLVLGR